jgi:hypothetical protein
MPKRQSFPEFQNKLHTTNAEALSATLRQLSVRTAAGEAERFIASNYGKIIHSVLNACEHTPANDPRRWQVIKNLCLNGAAVLQYVPERAVPPLLSEVLAAGEIRALAALQTVCCLLALKTEPHATRFPDTVRADIAKAMTVATTKFLQPNQSMAPEIADKFGQVLSEAAAALRAAAR